MIKKVLILISGLTFLLSSGTFGAKKPVDERILKRLEQIEQQVYPGEREDRVMKHFSFPESKLFLPFTGDTVGFTYYDYQANDVQRRMIANDYNGGLHFTWTNLEDINYPYEERYVYYNFYRFDEGWLDQGEGRRVSSYSGGYTELDILPDSREVLCYHSILPTYPDLPAFWGTTISIERTIPGLGEFRHYDIPDSITDGSMYHKGLWPTMACSKVLHSDTAYIHITHAKGYIFTDGDEKPFWGAPIHRDLGYVRCFEHPDPTTDSLVCMSPGWDAPLIIKNGTRLVPNKLPYKFTTATLGGTAMATSPVSQKICIAWLQNAASDYTKNEVWYLESTNNGNDWIASGDMGYIPPITDYAADGYKERAYPDIAAVYDYNDELHIMWTTGKATNENDVSLWHWSSTTGIRKVDSAEAPLAVKPGVWNLLIAKMTIGVGCDPSDSTYNHLYCVYTKFKEGDVSANGYGNGDIYVKASSNGGLTWPVEETLTNISTPGCLSGSCESEHWASIAERADSFFYVQYIYDLDAGGAPQEEGNYTHNPVRYLKRRLVVPKIPALSYSPVVLVTSAPNGGTAQDSMKFDNMGTDTLFVKLSGPPFVTINPDSFYIREAGPSQKVTLSFNGADLQDTLTVDSLRIASNDSLRGGGKVYADTQWAKIHFVVTDTFFYAEYDTCDLGVRLTVSNVGNLGNQEEGNQMSFNNRDYLFDCSPAFVTPDVNGEGPVGFTWLQSHNDFLPEGHLFDSTYANLDVKVWYTKKAIPGVPGRIQPLHGQLCNWFGYWTIYDRVVQFSYDYIHAVYVEYWWRWNPPPKWWNDLTGSTDPAGGYFGIAADWDIPAEAARRNNGDYDDTLGLIWMYGDTTGFEKYHGGFLWLYALVNGVHETEPFGAHVLANAATLYPDQGYDDDTLYKYMSTPGYSVQQDSAQDMNILMTFVEKLDPDSLTEIYTRCALIASDSGLGATPPVKKGSLYDVAAKIKKVVAGDANLDGKLSVSDVVYLIGYLFKGGPAPWRAYSDANGDAKLSVSDVVYLIGYLFKGSGQPPKLIWAQPMPPW